MGERAAVWVHGATGFTGKLVCLALKRRGVRFAAGGRSAEKLASLARELGDVETCLVDLAEADSIRAALDGRSIVLACAGPFVRVGEAILASAARAGVHYVDITGEQPFVALAVNRYRATAEASGACVVPAMGFEIALADWAAHLAAARVGGAPDGIAVAYMNQSPRVGRVRVTRGTKRSILAMVGDADAYQFENGALVREAPASRVARFTLRSGKSITAASFASPEAIVTPSHTGARSVHTYMAMDALGAHALKAARALVPGFARAAAPLLERAIDRAPEGPDEAYRRDSTFAVYVEATRGDARERLWVTGSDPYGLTAEIQAYAAARALAGAIHARGVVAPSVAFDPHEAFAALAFTGLRIE